MNVTTFPKAYSSVFRPALFVLSGVNSPLGVDVTVSSPARPGQPLGVKRIYASGSVNVNVAPYLRGMITIEPLCGGELGMVVPSSRTVPCQVSAPGFTSAAVVLAGGTEQTPSDTILCAAPGVVKIRPDEKDEISVVTSRLVDPEIVAYRGGVATVDRGTLRDISSSGMITTVVDPRAMCEPFAQAWGVPLEAITDLEIRLNLKGSSSQPDIRLVRRYTIDHHGIGGIRLAWVNRFGAVDYYTFPKVVSTRNSGSRTRIESPEGFRTLATRSERSQTLLSEPCDGRMADWLAEIFASPAVWSVTGSEYERVEVSGGGVTSSPAQPTRVEVEITQASDGTIRR